MSDAALGIVSLNFDSVVVLMPRPRKNDPTVLITPLVDDFARRLAALIERFTGDRVNAVARVNGKASRRVAARGRGARRRAKTLCYYPGCKNVAAPRFGMFCAAVHKQLPKAAKEKYRAARRK